MKYWVLVIIVVLIIVGYKFYMVEETTGYSVNNGIITLTKVGVAGIQMSDDSISLGSGYVNRDCEYAIVNSNLSNSCWWNTTIYSEDFHIIVNNGTAILNITAALANFTNAEDFFCGGSCDYSSSGKIGIYSLVDESNSCNGLTNYVEYIADASSVYTKGVCDYLDFADASDSIKIYVELYVPKDVIAGNKSFLINYEAIAY